MARAEAVALLLLALVEAERRVFCRYASKPATEPGAVLERRAEAGRRETE